MGQRNNRISRRTIFQSFYISQIFVLLFAYQNCSGPEGFNLASQQNETSSKDSGGSGVGYDGKLGGNYYRFIPGYSCAGQPSAKEIIQIQDQNTKLISNSVL